MILTLVRDTLFQFHKGTIRTPKDEPQQTQESYFNSIKVRLEHYPLMLQMMLLVFQFHKGTIRTILMKNTSLLLLYFNSIKVRLELIYALSLIGAFLFQFHKGTIRTYNGDFCFTLNSISIP